jgi:maltose alpha-D-glucosyltransferase/alpha-amylase
LSTLEPWARAWQDWVASVYLGGYLERAKGASFVPADDAATSILLEHYLLEKCIYEIGYELQNRPSWLDIPLLGLIALLESK